MTLAIIYSEITRERHVGIWMVTADGTGPPVELVGGPYAHFEAALSPDGRWLAYVSNRPGAAEIHVQRMTDPTQRWQLTSGGGRRPRWRRIGAAQELLYVGGAHLMSVHVAPGDAFRATSATPVFRLPAGAADYDAAPDGRLVLAIHSLPQAPPLTVVTNWTRYPTSGPR